MGPIDVMLWGAVLSEIADGVSRIVETAQRMQRGERVTKDDLIAARQRTVDAIKRLEAAVEAQSNGK